MCAMVKSAPSLALDLVPDRSSDLKALIDKDLKGFCAYSTPLRQCFDEVQDHEIHVSILLCRTYSMSSTGSTYYPDETLSLTYSTKTPLNTLDIYLPSNAYQDTSTRYWIMYFLRLSQFIILAQV